MLIIMYHLLFISGGELVVVALVFLLLFGSKKIPEMARGLGKGLREFKKAADDIKREITENVPDIKKNIDDLEKDVKKTSKDLLDDISKFKDDIQG
jgi:sec-independent protein translocase protein TatA